MKVCSRCGKEAAAEAKVSRQSLCPHCGAYLHACVNCAFYAPGKNNDCNEPQAEEARDKRSMNFCDYFRYKESRSPGAQKPPDDPRQAARDRPGNIGKNAAKDRFGKLFGS